MKHNRFAPLLFALALCCALCSCRNEKSDQGYESGQNVADALAKITAFADEPYYMLEVSSHMQAPLQDGTTAMTTMYFLKNAQQFTDGNEYYETKGSVTINGEVRAEPNISYYTESGLLSKGGASYSLNAEKADYDRLSYASFIYTITEPILPAEEDLRRATVTRDGPRVKYEITDLSQTLLSGFSRKVDSTFSGVSFYYTIENDRLSAYGLSYTVVAESGDNIVYHTDVHILAAGEDVPVLELETADPDDPTVTLPESGQENKP